jgi:hypothetical protein
MFALAPIATWGLVDIIIAVVIIAAIIGIMYVALRQFGVAIPQWAVTIFWICIVAIVAIFAIRFVAGL